MKRFASNLLAGAVVLMPASSIAETVVEDVIVIASIEAACTVNSPVLNFGTYDPGSGTDRTATAEIGIDCPEGAKVTISLDGGENKDGQGRRMARAGGNFLRYHLYGESRTQPWGDGDPTLGPPVVIPIYGHLSPKPSVFGELPAGQQVAPGLYTDSVLITITVEVNDGS